MSSASLTSQSSYEDRKVNWSDIPSHLLLQPKPTQRQMEIVKPANSRFGIDLCRVSGRVFVLKVHKPTAQTESSIKHTSAVSFAAYRVGLCRFDELIQVEEEFISNQGLETVYRYLHRSTNVNITIQERPLVNVHSVSTDAANSFDNLTIEGLYADGVPNDNKVVCIASGSKAASILPSGHAIVEVDGKMTLGMTQVEVLAVLHYARHKSTTGKVEICTMQRELARAFLSAYKLTADVYGHKDWKPVDHLRKSIRYSRRLSRQSSSGSISSPSMKLKERFSGSQATTSDKSGNNSNTPSQVESSHTATRTRSSPLRALSSLTLSSLGSSGRSSRLRSNSLEV